ncbi:phage baseplate protein [Rahnella aceris]|uniref:phage baseplate protein n=1 Tax=Rahnella sp. (strain Y9602) TaxID=2703885 RepID=UPI003B9F4C78
MATTFTNGSPSIAPPNVGGKDQLIFFPPELQTALSMSATTSIAYSSPFQVTSQPVMSGVTLSDHLQRAPRTISVEGVVVVQYHGTFLQHQDLGAVEDFIATTELWRDQHRVLSCISTSGVKLDKCFITNFEAKRDAQITNGVRVSMTFQEISFIEQLHRATLQAGSNANGSGGSSGGAKTKIKGIVGKKDVGSLTTELTSNQENCRAAINLVNRVGMSAASTEDLRQYSNCAHNNMPSAKGVIYGDIKTGARNSSMYQNTGGNPTKNLKTAKPSK